MVFFYPGPGISKSSRRPILIKMQYEITPLLVENIESRNASHRREVHICFVLDSDKNHPVLLTFALIY